MENKHEVMISLRLRTDELAKLGRLTEAEERNRSDVIRRLIRQAEDPAPLAELAKDPRP